MNQAKVRSSPAPAFRPIGMIIAVLLVLIVLLFSPLAGLWYSETKGPFKNWTQIVDLDADGDLDVLVSHTRWEEPDLSWAGIGRWINQGQGNFQRLLVDPGGFAGAAGDFDRDGQPELLVQDFNVRLLKDTGDGSGKLRSTGGINVLAGYSDQYRDMGGMLILGDWSGDGLLDAFGAGCCYGQNPNSSGSKTPNAPSRSWIWINAGKAGGSTRALADLDGVPVREAASGDLDGDGDLDLFAAVGAPTLGSTISLADQILLNDGAGNMQVMPLPYDDTYSSAAALGDINNDGRLDALVGKQDGAQIWINQGNDARGEPLFSLSGQTFTADRPLSMRIQAGLSGLGERLLGWELPFGSTLTKAVFLSDLDSDGDQDALIARLWQAEIWWNDGSGKFQKSAQRFPYREDTGAALGDFDGDGDIDLFLGANRPGYRLWRNDGTGVFSAARSW